MGDAQVERPQDHRLAVAKSVHAAEVVPQAERNCRKLQPAASTAVIAHGLVTEWRSVNNSFGSPVNFIKCNTCQKCPIRDEAGAVKNIG